MPRLRLAQQELGIPEDICMTSGLYYKSFTIVIDDRNDSGQYCKTTMLGS